MKKLRVALAALGMAAATGLTAPAQSSDEPPRPTPARAERAGSRDFDFLVGEWRVRHRRPKPGGREWVEFDGTCSNRQIMEGRANVEEHTLNAPGGTYRALALRSFDPKTRQWSIWWLDSRYPSGPLDPPVRGRFEQGVGTFYSDGTHEGRPVRVRFIWSQITADSARWEQALSSDAGKTWETNWVMEFRRVS